jgi:phosphoglycerate dehydrogenase-like enzyme
MTTIAVDAVFPGVADLVRSALPDDQVIATGDDRGLAAAADAEIALGSSSRAAARRLLSAAPKLRWYQSIHAGVDSILPEFRGGAVALTNNRGSYTVPVAEHVLMFLLAASQRLPRFLDQQRRKQWRAHQRGEINGKTLVIFGLGSIGQEIARLAQSVGMRVIGVRRLGGPVSGVHRVVSPEQTPQVVAEADYLVVAAPLTSATRGFISGDVIARMKASAWIVNIARGEIIDEMALVDALREGRIAGAALDVFQSEPLPDWSPLWAMENVIITPHVAANSDRVRARTLELFSDNVRRFKAGLELLNRVDIDAGY